MRWLQVCFRCWQYLSKCLRGSRALCYITRGRGENMFPQRSLWANERAALSSLFSGAKHKFLFEINKVSIYGRAITVGWTWWSLLCTCWIFNIWIWKLWKMLIQQGSIKTAGILNVKTWWRGVFKHKWSDTWFLWFFTLSSYATSTITHYKSLNIRCKWHWKCMLCSENVCPNYRERESVSQWASRWERLELTLCRSSGSTYLRTSGWGALMAALFTSSHSCLRLARYR